MGYGEGDEAAIVEVGAAAYGTAVANSDGTITYSPTLKGTMDSFDRGNFEPALNRLTEAFQNKVQAQIGKANPEIAGEWIRIAQQIADAVLLPQECDCEE